MTSALPDDPRHDDRGLLDRLMVLALQDAADRTYRHCSGRPRDEVAAVLRGELRVAGLGPGDAALPGAVRFAVARAAAEIADGRRPSILAPAGRQRATER